MTDAEGNEIGKLFVGGLSQATNNGSLRLYFSRFGEVDDAVVMMDNKTGRSRGFGYVKYREPESVNLALEAKPHILDGKEVDAKQCNVNMKGRNRRSLKIFVGGIGLDQDADSIKNYFRQFGRVTDVNLMMDSNKQRHRGFAFVGFEDETVVKRLINLHYVTMNNKQVEIKAMEPPNFGRKIGPSTCLTTAALMVGATQAENGSFESIPDTSGLIMSGLSGLAAGVPYTTHTSSYLSPSVSNLQCMQHNLLGQPRSTPPNTYEHQNGNFGASIIPDNLFSPGTYIQTVPVAQFTPRQAEMIPSGTQNNPYSAHKQSVPLIFTNGQYNSSTPMTPNGLNTFSQNPSSLYATIPCHLVPPQFLPNPHQPTVGSMGQLLNADKSWATTTHLTICPSQLPSQTSYMTCPPFANNHAAPSSGLQTDPNCAHMFTPYYALCPQYTTFPLQTDISGSTMYNAVQTAQCPSTLLSTGVPTCSSAAATTTGAGDNAVVQIPSNSRPPSPVTESKGELASSNKIVYPTLLMTTTNGLQNPTMVTPASQSINMGQTMWNNPPSNLIYSPLSVAWTVHPGAQTGQPQQWPSTVTMLPQPLTNTNGTGISQPNCTNFAKLNTETVPSLTQEGNLGAKETMIDSSQVTPTKASGDNLECLIQTDVQNEQRNSPHHYRSTRKPKDHTTGSAESQRSMSRLSDMNNWTMTGSNPICSGTNTTASWQGMTVSIPRWNELNDRTNSICPPNLNTDSLPWTLPIDLVDNSVSCIQASVHGNRVNSQSGVIHGSNNRRITVDPNTGLKPSSNVRSNQQNDSLKTCVDQSKCEPVTQVTTSAGFTKTSQRLSCYQSQSKPGTQHLINSDRQTLTASQSDTISSVNMVAKAKSALCGNANSQVNSSTRMNSNQSRNNDSRIDYTPWLYQNTTRSRHLEDNTGDRKEIQTDNSVESECQGPAGAAGDYHRPVHTGHFVSYQMTH